MEHADESLEELSKRLAIGFSTGGEDSARDLTAHGHLIEQVVQLTALIRKFDAAHEDNPTFCYWRKYMHLVSILVRFTRALREGDYKLYFSSFAEMLPWFSTFDHVNYTRLGVVHLADMKLLPQTASKVHQRFQRCDFVTKETHKAFNQNPNDQALEHVNKSGKVAGGLVGITRADSARDRWCLTYNERAQLSENTRLSGKRECDAMKRMSSSWSLSSRSMNSSHNRVSCSYNRRCCK